MPVLVSCWHCKRAVLMVQRMTERELVLLGDHLADHLAACGRDDPPLGLGVENLLRHFRVVEVEGERGTDRAARNGERYAR